MNPGTFSEFDKVIEPLANPKAHGRPGAQAFHVVVPSLPGFIFSAPPPTSTPGIGDAKGYSRILNALMRGLGYDRYACQGGDWGSIHVRCLGALHAYPDGTGCRAVHINFWSVSSLV
jgi:epoxide hydrolase